MKKTIILIIFFFFSFTFAQQSDYEKELLVLGAASKFTYIKYKVTTDEVIETKTLNSSVVFYFDKDFKYIIRVFTADERKQNTKLYIENIEYLKDNDIIKFFIKTIGGIHLISMVKKDFIIERIEGATERIIVMYFLNK